MLVSLSRVSAAKQTPESHKLYKIDDFVPPPDWYIRWEGSATGLLPVESASNEEKIGRARSVSRTYYIETTRRGGQADVRRSIKWCDPMRPTQASWRDYHAKCAKALFDSAILMVFSRLVIASPSRR